MDINDREGVLGEIRDGGERHRLIYNLTNTQRLPKPGVPALTRCHFNSRRRLHWNTDKRQNSSLCKGFRKLFTTAWREINVIRELHYNHTCFSTAHSDSGNICELRALKPHEIEIRVVAFSRWVFLFSFEAIWMIVYYKSWQPVLMYSFCMISNFVLYQSSYKYFFYIFRHLKCNL